MEENDRQERTIYISSLHEKVTENILKELFIQVGPIESVTVREQKRDDKTPSKPRFAFVEFSDQESVLFACQLMDALELYGQKIKVQPRDGSRQQENYIRSGMKQRSSELHRTVTRRQSEALLVPPTPPPVLVSYGDRPVPLNETAIPNRRSDSLLMQRQYGGQSTTSADIKRSNFTPDSWRRPQQQLPPNPSPMNANYSGAAASLSNFMLPPPPPPPTFYQPTVDYVNSKLEQSGGKYRNNRLSNGGDMNRNSRDAKYLPRHMEHDGKGTPRSRNDKRNFPRKW